MLRMFAGEQCALISKILRGDFVSALLSPEAQQWLQTDKIQTKNSVSGYFQHIQTLLLQEAALADRCHQLQTAVACLLLFLQANLTGYAHFAARFIVCQSAWTQKKHYRCLQASYNLCRMPCQSRSRKSIRYPNVC